MNLNFQSPLYFLGLVAVVIPIIIHLLERKREITISLPTVRFIMEAHRRIARRLKIRRWILLLSRIMMIIILSSILARPVLVSREALVSEIRPQSTVIILDNSASLFYRQGGLTRWDEARGLASEFAAMILGAGEAAVLTTGGREEDGRFVRDYKQIEGRLEKLSPTEKATDFANSLNRAYLMMEQAAYPDRQIVLITDMGRPEWGRFEVSMLEKPLLDVPVRVLDISGEKEGWNKAVMGFDVITEPGEEGIGRVRVVLRGFGDVAKKKTTLQLDLNDRILARRIVESEDGGEQVYDFNLPRLQSGVHRIVASIDTDPLAFDNRFYGTFDYGGQIRVMTVDGSPQASLVNSETFFLRAALVPDRFSEDRKIDNFVIFPGQLKEGLLRQHDIVILANVRSLDAPMAMALSRWVNEGGGLIIFLGENYQPGVYQASFDAGGADLLPVYLGNVAEPPRDGTIGYLDYESPPLQVFRREGQGGFSRARFQRYVSPAAGGLKPGAKSLISFEENGEMPLMVERTMGKGKVILFTSSADLDWNNLPAQTVYLPLIQRSLEYLARTGGLSIGQSFDVGEPASLGLTEDIGRKEITVTSPSGKREVAPVESGPSGSRAYLGEAGEAGFYYFYPEGTEVPVSSNVDRRESDVRRVPDEKLEALEEVLPLEILHLDEAGITVKSLRGTRDLAPLFFIMLLCLLVLEGTMSISGRSRDKS